jgi:hypothetical protein
MRGATHPRESGDLDDRYSDCERRPEEPCRRHPLAVAVEKRRGLARRSRCSSSCDDSILDHRRRNRSLDCSPATVSGRVRGGSQPVSNRDAVGARSRVCACVTRRSARSRRDFAQHRPLNWGLRRFIGSVEGARGHECESVAVVAASVPSRVCGVIGSVVLNEQRNPCARAAPSTFLSGLRHPGDVG